MSFKENDCITRASDNINAIVVVVRETYTIVRKVPDDEALKICRHDLHLWDYTMSEEERIWVKPDLPELKVEIVRQVSGKVDVFIDGYPSVRIQGCVQAWIRWQHAPVGRW